MVTDLHIVGRIAMDANAEQLGQSTANLYIDEIDFILRRRGVPILGVYADVGNWIKPLQGLGLGLSYRGEGAISATTTVDAQINADIVGIDEIEGLSMDVVLPAMLSFYDHFMPRQTTLGIDYLWRDRAHLSVSFWHSQWSRMNLNVAQLLEGNAQASLWGGDIEIEDGNQFAVEFVDRISTRVGGSYRFPAVWENRFGQGDIEWRFGYALEPKPLAGIGRNMSLLDASRSVFCTGFETAQAVDKSGQRVAFSGAFQWHRLASSEVEVLYDSGQAGAPIGGTSIPIQGAIYTWGIQGGVTF